ncbi:MAG: hypothetical protein FWC75_01835 [Oscillospiraceae bacterium]|nr:hypothetical protein [Oscillospiraceae bacterium]
MEVNPNLAATAWTLIPIAITIICVFLTRRILLSLFVGIIAAAFMSANFIVFDTVMLVERTMTGIIFSDGQTALFSVFSRWYLSIIIFLLGLGVVTSTVVLTGGARAFVNAVASKVKSRKGVQFITVIIGVVLMIDDYFNAMVNGNIAKTVSAKHNLSRARSSYIVDSIAAPICIVAPVSSWAVAIMGNMGTTYESIGQYGRNVFLDFLRMIPYQFYVFAAIGLVIVTICVDFNMFSMRKYERAINEEGKDIAAEESDVGLIVGETSTKGTIWDFWIPIICLALATIATMLVTGWQSADPTEIYEGGFLYAILDNMSLSMSLLMGGIAALVSSMYIALRHVNKGEVTKQQYWKAIVAGLKSMVNPIAILVLSWTISTLIGHLEVGDWVAEILYASGIYGGFIPFIMFISAALLAFAIGTSWGTFAIVLPIAGAVVSTTGNMHLLLPAMAAVLSGAVFGDHASPISDTTVLSSAGTSCKVLAHFESQLPYAILAAILTAIGFLFFGLSGTVIVGYLAFAVALAITVVCFIFIKKRRGAAY